MCLGGRSERLVTRGVKGHELVTRRDEGHILVRCAIHPQVAARVPDHGMREDPLDRNLKGEARRPARRGGSRLRVEP